MLKDAAIAWVRGNCSDPKLRSDLSRMLKDALQRRIDCWFGVGQALTKERVPYVIHCFAGELFIFQLSPAQAAGLMLAPHALIEDKDPRASSREARSPHLPVSIRRLELDRPTLTLGERIEGSIEYEIEGVTPAAYCLRLDCLLGLLGNDVIWSTPDQDLCRSGQLRFSFDALRDSAWPFVQMQQRPLALFLQMYSRSDQDEVTARRPLSNTCGTLLDVAT